MNLGQEVCKLKLLKTEDIKNFCNLMMKFESDLSLCYGRFVIDAKSIMGVLSLDGSKELTLYILEKKEGEYEQIKKLMDDFNYNIKGK